MSTERRLRQDSAANLAGVTPQQGEPAYDQTNGRMRWGNGVKQGAYPSALIRDVQRQVGTFLSVSGSGSPPDFDTLIGSTGATNDGLAIEAYVAGQKFGFFPPGENTGAVTINIDGQGATAIQNQGAALEGGELIAARYVEVIYDGTQFQLISSNGAGVWEVVEEQTVSSAVSAVDFTGIPYATYNHFELRISGLRAQSAGVNLEMRMGPDGGSIDTGANYQWITIDANSGVATVDGDFDVSDNRIRIASELSSAAANRLNGVISFADLAGNGNKAVGGRTFAFSQTSRAVQYLSAGSHAETTAIDKLRLFTSSGNINAGVFTLLGMKGA